jgi:hypothetical protein
MLVKNKSGQYLYFSLVSTLSGIAVTGSSGSISGRKSLDGLSGMIVLSGNIIELGGGSYRANLYDFDTNGDYAGYLFTASGCVPVQYSMITQGGISGNTFLGSGSITSGLIASGIVFVASGPFVNTPRDTLSGLMVNSGLYVTVPIATISGNISNSGLFVTVPKETISGVIANSGIFVTVPIATISGVIANSGLSVIATLYSGTANSGQTVATYSGVWGTASLNSGQSVLVYSGQLSGQRVDLLSGNQTQVWSGTYVNVFSGSFSGTQHLNAFSGVNAVVPKETLSGVVANSGLFATVLPANLSGVFGTASLNSGQEVLVYSGQLSGQQLTARTVTDKTDYLIASGNLSGQVVTAASGAFVVTSIASGTTYLASGHPATLYSGQLVMVYSGNLSGQLVTAEVATKTGFTLASSGLDAVVVETGLNARQALSIVGAAVAGKLSGAGTATITMAGAGVAAERLAATVDGSGNRSSVTLTPPA